MTRQLQTAGVLADVVPNRWYGMLASSDLKDRPVAITRMGESLVLYRTPDGVACLPDACSHRGVALSKGRVLASEIECPYHGFRFSAEGQCTLMPCEGSEARLPKAMALDALACREANGIIWVFWGGRDKADRPMPWMDEVPGTPYTSEASLVWPTPFSAAVEANLDFHHTAPLHATRRGGRGWKLPNSLSTVTYVADLDTSVDGDRVDVSIRMVRDESRDSGPELTGHSSVLAPGLSYVVAGQGRFKVLVVDCPIDDSSTHRIMRYHNDTVGRPLVGPAIAWALRVLDMGLIQKAEDAWILDTVPPTGFRDRLVGSDAAIIEYRRVVRRALAEEVADEANLPSIVRRHLPGTGPGRSSDPLFSVDASGGPSPVALGGSRARRGTDVTA